MFYTHNDIQPLQAGEALEEVKHSIQMRASRFNNQNPHGVHFGCQADSMQSLQKYKTSAHKKKKKTCI